MTTDVKTTKVRALNVKPHRWAAWCSIEDSEPFANEIVLRRWSDDGTTIWFMLESHNFMKAEPHEELDLVPFDGGYSEAFLASTDAEDERRMGERPYRPAACTHCGRT